MPTTTLRITIDGLFLYVHSQKENRLTLLMPITAKNHFGLPVPQHDARLVVPHTASPNPHNAGDYDQYQIGGTLDIPAAMTGSVKTKPPAKILDLLQYTKVGVDRALLSGNHPDVFARVHLWSGKSIGTSPSVKFRVNGAVKSMSHQLVWQMKHDEAQLDLPTVGGGITLRPQTGNTIQFTIGYMPPAHFPGGMHTTPNAPRGYQVSHYAALYSLFTNPKIVAIPSYESGVEVYAKAKSAMHMFGGDPVTCVGGGAPPK